MRVDVLALQRFYGSPLGKLAQRMVAQRLLALWPAATGLDMLGLGYPTPFLDPYRAGARRCVALMPAAQGAERWPAAGAGLATLGDDQRLPFMDAVFDRAILAHALEEADSARALLRELWRVMAPEGRVVVVVANRSGLWARADGTPFGHGRPYSRTQLAALLRDSLFEPTASARALYAPPIGWGPLLALADGFERMGAIATPAFGGLLLMEAVKRLAAPPYATHARVVRVKAAKPAAAPGAACGTAQERVSWRHRSADVPRP